MIYNRQVTYALSPPGTSGHAPHWVIAAPRVSGSVTTGIDGSFTLPPLPDGNYGICVVSPLPGYLDSCQFTPGTLASVSQGRAPALSDIRLKTGTEIHIRINDPLHLAPKSARSGPVPLIVGVLTHGTTFYAARIIAEDASGRDHTITVPIGTPVKLWVFSRTVKVADITGKLIDSKGYALPLQALANTPRMDYVFTVTGAQ